MVVRIPEGWIILLNVLGWPVIQLGFAWVFTRLPEKLFSSGMGTADWEGMFYARILGVRKWKGLLPDGAPWVSGFAKRDLRSADVEYLKKFVAETRRGEAAHWAMMVAGGVFFLWNPLWACAVMGGYAVAANLPCIVTQRYNRLRMLRVLQPRQPRR